MKRESRANRERTRRRKFCKPYLIPIVVTERSFGKAEIAGNKPENLPIGSSDNAFRHGAIVAKAV